MRKFTLLSLLLFTFFSGQAQKGLFASFDHDFDTILDHLSEQEGMAFLSIDLDREIKMEYNNTETTFLFNKGTLYKLSMELTFEKDSLLISHFHKALNQIESIDARKVSQSDSGNDVIAIKDGAVLELHIIQKENGDSRLIISCKKAKNTPKDELESYDLMVDDVFI